MKIYFFVLIFLVASRFSNAQENITQLKNSFLSSSEPQEKVQLLNKLSLSTPTSSTDIYSLYDLFMRYPDSTIRQNVMSSLSRVDKSKTEFEPLFLNYLEQPDPESQLFGINGAFRLRSSRCLPLIKKIAKKKFEGETPMGLSILSERNVWWTQFEALSVLAQWEKEETLPLLHKKLSESPNVAAILGANYWVREFPSLKKWSVSNDVREQQMALEMSQAPIDRMDARATRDEMLAIVRNPKIQGSIRHALALKAGACSNDEEVASLIDEHNSSKDETLRLLLVGAIAISQSQKAIPLLIDYALHSTDEAYRKGAKDQLVDMLGATEAEARLNSQKDQKK